ncbi:antitermination protein [Rodentibacter caecimuris]|nr:antiterminator Q family protein [Rodentibacter heylii]QIA76666.1 antitermination protein [Rodentibacter heylii]
MNYSVERVLEKWGNCWGRARIGTEYPSTTISIPVLPTPRKAYVKFLIDDECLLIEKQIMNLHADNLLQYQILMALYVQKAKERDICNALGISPARMYRERAQGIRFLKGAFTGAKIKFMFLG